MNQDIEDIRSKANKLKPIERVRLLRQLSHDNDVEITEFRSIKKRVLTRGEILDLINRQFNRKDVDFAQVDVAFWGSPKDKCAGMVYTILRHFHISFINDKGHPVKLSHKVFAGIYGLERHMVGKYLYYDDYYQASQPYKGNAKIRYEAMDKVEEDVFQFLNDQ